MSCVILTGHMVEEDNKLILMISLKSLSVNQSKSFWPSDFYSTLALLVRETKYMRSVSGTNYLWLPCHRCSCYNKEGIMYIIQHMWNWQSEYNTVRTYTLSARFHYEWRNNVGVVEIGLVILQLQVMDIHVCCPLCSNLFKIVYVISC